MSSRCPSISRAAAAALAVPAVVVLLAGCGESSTSSSSASSAPAPTPSAATGTSASSTKTTAGAPTTSSPSHSSTSPAAPTGSSTPSATTPAAPAGVRVLRRFSGHGNTALGTIPLHSPAVLAWSAGQPPMQIFTSRGFLLVNSKGSSGTVRLARGTYRGVRVASRGSWVVELRS
jgi:hypothetical protein